MSTDPQDTAAQFKQKLAPANALYFTKVQEASKLVEEVMQKNPDFDRADLFRIAMKRYDSADQKLAGGLRRRVLGNVAVIKQK